MNITKHTSITRVAMAAVAACPNEGSPGEQQHSVPSGDGLRALPVRSFIGMFEVCQLCLFCICDSQDEGNQQAKAKLCKQSETWRGSQALKSSSERLRVLTVLIKTTAAKSLSSLLTPTSLL